MMAAMVGLGVGAAACGSPTGPSATANRHEIRPALDPHVQRAKATTTTAPPTTSTTTTTTEPPTTTTTTEPPTTTTTGPTAPAQVAPNPGEGPITSPPLPPPGPGFVPDHVTAVGDSVMIDYEGLLEQDVPGIAVTAAVSRGWTAGETVLRQLEASGQLGAVVVVGLATNGPVTATQFNSMMTLLAGASRVVFVNTRVDRTWQTANNAVLAAGVDRTTRAVLADWYSLAAADPQWLYPTQTHLPIDGTGAAALAALVASKV